MKYWHFSKSRSIWGWLTFESFWLTLINFKKLIKCDFQADQSVLEQTKADQSRPEQTSQDQSSPEQTRADQSRPEQTSQGQSRPEQTRPGPLGRNLINFWLTFGVINFWFAWKIFVKPMKYWHFQQVEQFEAD